MNDCLDNHGLVKRFAVVLAALGLFTATAAFADGTTERERTMSRYSKCKWTDTMSKELYECVKRNDGFNTHWCFDETLQMNCDLEALEAAAAEEATAQAVAQPAAHVAADTTTSNEQAKKRAARQGEENLRGTIEREQTMLKYKDCEWTDEMGRYTYECVKRNDGFGTHWCYDEALQLHCPKPTEAAEPQS